MLLVGTLMVLVSAMLAEKVIRPRERFSIGLKTNTKRSKERV
jgi:hypothetical protein